MVVSASPQLIEKPQDVQKPIDDSLVWECKATGKPKPSYRWMKNGENLEPTEVSSPLRFEDGQQTFVADVQILLMSYDRNFIKDYTVKLSYCVNLLLIY